MKIIFLGGTETVTGSKFLVETKNTRILVDCGLFQGYKWLRERNRQTLPLDIDTLDAIVLTHAHLDHSGYVPVMYKKGYRGPVFTHHATKDLCRILLADSGHIQEEDARFYGKHKLSKHENPEPLYDRATAEASMQLFQGIEFEETVEVGDIRFHLQPVGHILGAGSVIIEAEGKRIGFSGDVGRPDDIIAYPPKPLPELDLLMLESTYGDRRHSNEDPYEQLADIVKHTAKRGGTLLIPSFAVGRAQTLQHMLISMMKEGRIPPLPIYLDSPMAIDVSELYCDHVSIHKLSVKEANQMCQSVHYTREIDESKALSEITYPHIVIAGSGMATGGRILHHFKRLIGDPKTTVLFAGYQSGGTRGAKMLAGAKSIKLHGEWLPIRATIDSIDSLSGHADYVDIEQWVKASKMRAGTQIYLIHGEPEALEGMRDHLQQTTNFRIDIAGYMRILHV